MFFYRKLNFDKDESTALFHVYELLAYIFPVVGAIIAESWLGNFKTILWMVFTFMVGNIIITVGTVELLNLPMM